MAVAVAMGVGGLGLTTKFGLELVERNELVQIRMYGTDRGSLAEVRHGGLPIEVGLSVLLACLAMGHVIVP